MTYSLSRFIFKFLFFVLSKFRVFGRENLPDKGPFIIAANHTSLADPPIVGLACNKNPVRFMAKKELFEIPIFGRWIKAVHCIPVEPGSSFGTLKEAICSLKEGKVVAIFPEGSRSPDGNLQAPQLGIGLIALKSGAPIFPLYISGTEKCLSKNTKWIKPGCEFIARIGKPVDISDSRNIADKRGAYQYIGRKVMSAIVALKNE